MNPPFDNRDLPRREKASRAGRMLIAPLLLCLGFTFSCATVLTPIGPGADGSIAPDEGLVLGRIHVIGSGGERFTSTDQPFHARFHVQWRVRDQARGKEFLVDGLPSDGPFVLKFPTGSYQLTAVSFDTALGVWQTSLPTSFTVTPLECTYLGTWELRTRTGFFDGSVVRHVVDQHARAENDLHSIVNNGLRYPVITELSSSTASPLILTFRTQGTDLTSPP